MHGVVAAGGPETAAAGAAILSQGGNAVDAAVAAAFTSFFAEIGVVHLGGSGIAHIYDPADGSSTVYDFFSNAPGLGQEQSGELDFGPVTIDFGATTQEFHLGRASVAVPGNIVGLCRMASIHGRLPLIKLLEPAINLARDGLSIPRFQASTCRLLEPIYTHTEGMRNIFASSGTIIQPGERLYVPHLAETLEKLAKEGEALARDGALAKALVADQAGNGGLLTKEDLTAYQVFARPSIRLNYRGYEILLPPPCSTGGVLTAFTLKMLCGFDLTQIVYGSAAHLRLLFELMAATSAARLEWERGFPDAADDEAVSTFLSDNFVSTYTEQVRSAIARRHISDPFPEAPSASNTSHLSVIDGDGLAVSLTTTAGESAGYVVPGTGYIPNNIMGEADLHPSGFHSLPSGTRIATMMTPTIVLSQGQTRLVLGSGGSLRIRSAILQVLSNLLDFGMNLDQSVNIARVHLENGILQCEAGIDPAAMDELEQMGYLVNRWDQRSIYFGGAHSVSRTESGRLAAAGDSRRAGSTASS